MVAEIAQIGFHQPTSSSPGAYRRAHPAHSLRAALSALRTLCSFGFRGSRREPGIGVWIGNGSAALADATRHGRIAESIWQTRLGRGSAHFGFRSLRGDLMAVERDGDGG